MAEKQAGGLSLRIGLTLNQLQSDFLAAEQTVRQGIAALNRQQNIVKLKMETDITGLDSVTDKTKILEIQERSLTQLLEMQRDKLTLATKAYQEYASSKNANAAVTKNLETAMERERLAVARLESQLKSLSAQRISLDTTQLQENIARLNSRIQHIKIQADIDTSKLQGATAAFDAQKIHIAAVTRELELQRQKLIQLRAAMYQSAKATGSNSIQTLNIKSNVLQQIQEINRLETKLKELQNTNINLQIRADSIKQAENQIQENISRLNARLENIRVKAEIDTSKISAATSEFDKAKAHVQNLNKELDIQNQKLAEMRKALATSVSTNGLNNVKTITLSTEIQKQIQAIDQLKAKINELNKIQPPKTNSLLSGYFNIKGDVTGKLNEITSAFSQLQGATASADSAITSVLGVIGTIPHPVGRAVAAVASLPIVFKGVENSIVSLTEAAAASGDSVYVMSRGFQMTIADTGKFTSMCKTAGVEVNDLASTLKRVQQTIVRGGEDAKAEQWLKRYGESAFDANGKLKDLNEMTLSLSRALKRAQADGNGMAFILATMRGASADAITAIEDAEDVYKQASTIVKNGLANPALAHEVQGNINAMKLQASQLNGSFTSALLPVANEVIPRLTERMGKMTQIIADNKDVIKEVGKDLASIWNGIETAAEVVGGAVAKIGSGIKDIYMARSTAEKRLVDRYKDDTNIQTAEDLLQRELSRGYTPQDRAAIEATPYLYEQELKKYEPLIKAIQDARKEIQEEKKTLTEELSSVANISSAANDRFKIKENPELLKQAESVKKILQEASDIQYKLSHTDYENKKLDVLQWQQDLLNQTELTDEKREAIEKLAAAKSAQIEQERADKLAEIRDSVAAADKTALENKLDNIEKERQAWLKAGMEKTEAEMLAQKQLTDYIKKAEEELSNSLSMIYNTELENRLAQIEKERQAWIDKCGDEVKATQLAEQAKADAQRNAAMSVLKQQAEEYEAFQQGGYAGLRAYKANQLAEQGVNPDYLYMTPQQLQAFQKASQVAEKSMMPNFMTEHDRAEHYQQMQDWQDWKRQRYEELDKDNYVIVDGVKRGISEVLKDTPIEISLGKNDTEEAHTLRVSSEGDSYTKTDNKYSYDKKGQLTESEINFREGTLPVISEEMTQPLIESFAEIPPAVQDVTESLDELPTAIQGIFESLSEIAEPQMDSSINPFSDLEPIIQSAIQSLSEFGQAIQNEIQSISSFGQEIPNVVQSIAGMNSGFSEVTVKLSDLSQALANFILPQQEQNEKVPVEVNTTVQIDEAHAWDYDHIQELAEKVADIIKPEIISAIGGDSNSY